MVSHFLEVVYCCKFDSQHHRATGGSFTDGTNLAELPLEGDGWIRATLPCHTTKDIEEAFLQVHSVYREWVETEYVGRGKTMHME